MQQHIQPLVGAQERQPQPVVEIHQLLRASREGRVHLSVARVRTLPQLRVAHRPQELIDLILLVDGAGCYLQTIDLLQDLGFLAEQLL